MSEVIEQNFPARVIEIIDSYKVVINRGSSVVRKGQRFLIYSIGKELIDPVTNESLGRLELVRGTGVVTHIQEKICTVSADQRGATSRRKIKRTDAYSMMTGRGEEVIEELGEMEPFDEPSIGDFVKPI